MCCFTIYDTHLQTVIFDGPIPTLLSALLILTEVLSRAHVKRKEVLSDFKFGIFIAHFPNDNATSMAVKGLKLI